MSTPNGSDVREESIVLRFPHKKDDLRHITVSDETGKYEVYRLAPVIKDWPAELVPDRVNPRSHDEECLKTPVARDIEETLRSSPEDFWLANRGGYMLADRVKFDPIKSVVEIILTDLDIHGMADGATSNAVIAKIKKDWKDGEDELEATLERARFNLDVVVGLTDDDRIAKLVQGRNRSVQVKAWSLNDFRGKFDWLKGVLDADQAPFAGKIGWEENAGKAVTVLDVISLLTLLHPEYGNSAGRRRAPTVAFSSKGTADKRFTDPKMEAGYKALSPVIEDILRLHDYVFAKFEPTYEQYNKEVHNKGSRLGKRKGVDNKPYLLPLTGTESEYKIDKGLIFPLLSAFRALLRFDDNGAHWVVKPEDFFDKKGVDLMAVLIQHYELCRGNPATVGKTTLVYTALYNQACMLLPEMTKE